MLVGEPWERVTIDITGNHPKSRNGNEYILTVIDHFTKWAETSVEESQVSSSGEDAS